jgi:hypothetical protein
MVFEKIYKTEMGTEDFDLKDLRENRNDTDYRLYDTKQHAVYRINIKFAGAMFEQAYQWVSLDTLDCFPLATYKIHYALNKQREEHLPYIFVIVNVPGLTHNSIADTIPDNIAKPLTAIFKSPKVAGKRNYEDRIIDVIVLSNSPIFVSLCDRIGGADWFVLSAGKADALLRKLLFERVFALRVRGFAQKFRRAELDMHYSLKQDLIPLSEMLRILREEGQHAVTSRLASGAI